MQKTIINLTVGLLKVPIDRFQIPDSYYKYFAFYFLRGGL